MKPTLRHLFGFVLAGCVSFALGACESPVTEEDGGNEDGTEEGVSEVDEHPDYAPQKVDCAGTQNNWCLTTCSKTGDYLHVVGHKNGIASCPDAGEDYCHSHGLGYRTKACWGHL